jgi:hypothetical protein
MNKATTRHLAAISVKLSKTHERAREKRDRASPSPAPQKPKPIAQWEGEGGALPTTGAPKGTPPVKP